MATRINFGGSGKSVTRTNWAQQNINRMIKELGKKDPNTSELKSIPFTKKEEVDAYLSGEKIKCLECGNMMTKIGGMHLTKHGLTAAKYKEKYNIPRKMALQSKWLSEVFSENQKTPKARERQKKLVSLKSWEKVNKQKTFRKYDNKIKELICECCGNTYSKKSIDFKKDQKFCSRSCCMKARWSDQTDIIYSSNVFVKRGLNK